VHGRNRTRDARVAEAGEGIRGRSREGLTVGPHVAVSQREKKMAADTWARQKEGEADGWGRGGLRVASNGWWFDSAQIRPIKEWNKDFTILE
jgi:hypothetical protein